MNLILLFQDYPWINMKALLKTLTIRECKRQMNIVQNRQMKSVHPYLCFPFFFTSPCKAEDYPSAGLWACKTHPWCSTPCNDVKSCPGWLMPSPDLPWPHPILKKTCWMWRSWMISHTCARQTGIGDSIPHGSMADNQSHPLSWSCTLNSFWGGC